MERELRLALANQNPELTEVRLLSFPKPIYLIKLTKNTAPKKCTSLQRPGRLPRHSHPACSSRKHKIPTHSRQHLHPIYHHHLHRNRPLNPRPRWSDNKDPNSSPEGPSRRWIPRTGILPWWRILSGGLENEVSLCRKWTELGGVAVNVDYRLALNMYSLLLFMIRMVLFFGYVSSPSSFLLPADLE
jgi:hypothetical protein